MVLVALQGVFDNGACDVVIVPLVASAAANNAHVAAIESSVATSSHGQYISAFLSMEASQARELHSSARHLLNGQKKYVMMSSDIFTGLVIGLFLFATALVGVCCLMSIQTPTKFCSEALPGTKEF